MAEVIVRAVGVSGVTLEVIESPRLVVRVESRARNLVIIDTFSPENIVEFAHLIIKQWGGGK